MINIAISVLYFFEVLCALLLIGIILIQQSKSGGGLGAIGGGMTESVFGTAAGNVITKTTVVLASIFLVLTMVLAVMTSHRGRPQTLADRLGDAAPAATVEENTPDPAVTAPEETGTATDVDETADADESPTTPTK